MSLTDQPCQCPCCDYYTLTERGAHEVCPVCYWEDDGHDLDRLDEVSAVCHITLRQARANFAAFGAADQAAISLVASREEILGLRRELRANV